ncbi:hypothetical protein GYMLUDRAFT_1027081 [Collybiopsis luxurians FD-317 M1]|uniref:Uncharacterized protein n=1 Tax=Collybiopsis luxurians FD-317 M1 TaxID=944289 RepID=A0A0D0BTX2_9AGAR|nr:hypothetical protein GYMLUDRAFT_1027081 [Collybiopsis luxurians FD-317 M1]
MLDNAAPNPAIPFELLPPSIALQAQVASYVYAATAGILLWDVLANILADWQLFHTAKNKLHLATYMISRIGTMTFILGHVIYATYPVGNCKTGRIAIDSFYPIGISGSCLLFFFRARAVYNGHNNVNICFTILWVTVFSTCLLIPFGTISENIGPTLYCTITKIKPFAGIAVIVPAVYDTVIFLAVSYKLMSHSFADPQGLQERIWGKNLPAYSRAVFRDGQRYYLMTVLGNMAMISLMYAPINPAYQTIFTLPNVMLTNIMACYVYRHTVLGSTICEPTCSMDAYIIPTQKNALGNALATPGTTGTSAIMDGIFVEMTQEVHVDEETKSGGSFLSV